jgi:membrane protease YdiL (CAAX protease family)
MTTQTITRFISARTCAVCRWCNMTQSIRRYPLVPLLVLAFGITWAIQIPRATGLLEGEVWQAVTWAPAIAALLAAALTGGRAAVRELGARLVRWRVGWQWYLVVILGPAVFSVVVAGIYVMLGGSWAEAAPPALREGPLLLLPIFLGVLTLTDGLGEELAWRGFALPRQSRFCSPGSSCILAEAF